MHSTGKLPCFDVMSYKYLEFHTLRFKITSLPLHLTGNKWFVEKNHQHTSYFKCTPAPCC